jgi:hypothetical protein
LREGQKDVEGKAAHGSRGVESLRYRDKRDAFAIEHLHKASKVLERATEPVDLVDDNDINATGFDICQKPSEGRAPCNVSLVSSH